MLLRDLCVFVVFVPERRRGASWSLWLPIHADRRDHRARPRVEGHAQARRAGWTDARDALVADGRALADRGPRAVDVGLGGPPVDALAEGDRLLQHDAAEL